MELLERGTPQESSQEAIAFQVGEALNKHYPNHPWVISFQGGAIIIRHLSIAHAVWRELKRDGFGAVMNPKMLNTPTEITKSAVRFGGELLEAFGLPRGAWDGREPVVPERMKVRHNVLVH